jgi:hypothetical protein
VIIRNVVALTRGAFLDADRLVQGNAEQVIRAACVTPYKGGKRCRCTKQEAFHADSPE